MNIIESEAAEIANLEEAIASANAKTAKMKVNSARTQAQIDWHEAGCPVINPQLAN